MIEYLAVERALGPTKAFNCLECGKCTANCPVARFNGGLSPRRMLGRALSGSMEALLSDDSMWSCLTCSMCEPRCPADVNFTDLLRIVRSEALPARKSWPVCTHDETPHTWMRSMTSPILEQRRLEWLPDDVEVAEEGDVLLFVGCAPYYDAYFKSLEVSTVDSAIASISLLNKVGIVPAVLNEERCCGHDLLWTGDKANYEKLAELNAEAIRASGATTIITACAECFRTLKLDYPETLGTDEWKVQHISEFIAEKVDSGELAHSNGSGNGKPVVTYQDPCRLGRHSGVYDAPRQVIDEIDLELVEMERSGEGALCCGVNSWINCDLTSKKIQAARLTSAKETGADMLLTSCPKCLIHFKCALQDEALAKRANIEIRDLSVVAAEAMVEVNDE
jgi:heterodisulfide reductase subunit D